MAFNESDFQNAKTVSAPNPKMKRITVLWVILLVLLAAALVAGSMYIQYIQVREVGVQYTEVYWTNLRVSIVSQICSFLVVFILHGC